MSSRATGDPKNVQCGRALSTIELVISVGIMVMLTTVLLLNYNKVGQRIAVNTLAHQVAQSIREAQVLAMSVKRTTASNTTFPGYGLRFAESCPGQFVLFADFSARNKDYDTSGACNDAPTERQQLIQFDGQNRVVSVCVSSGTDCPAANGNDNRVDIVFTRPEPDANIRGNVTGAGSSAAYTDIELGVPGFYTRKVRVWTTGQISVL